MFYTGHFFFLTLLIYGLQKKKKRKIHADDLDDGYNVVRSEMKKGSQWGERAVKLVVPQLLG